MSGIVSEPALALSPSELVADRYRPLRPLGSGGSGSVWLARDERTGLDVALKIVPREGKAASRAEREAGKKGLGVVGDYHSHPDHPAVPSAFDLDHSPWTTMSYIVVSVLKGRAAELRSWEIAEDHSKFNEEEIVKGS